MNLNLYVPAFLCDWPFYAGFAAALICAAILFAIFLSQCGPRF